VVRSNLLCGLSYVTVVPITTDLRPNVGLRIDLAPSAGNGLLAPSQVMVDWPQTVRLSGMGEAISSLDTATRRAITRQMAVALGIGSDTSRVRRTRTRQLDRKPPQPKGPPDR
jgi:hypothetical protein